MEQTTTPSLSISKSITDDEREVSEILINLHNLIRKSESYFSLPVWGVKGRRSAINLTPSPPHHPRPEKKLKIVAGEPSPVTPLSFSPSESDDKTQQSLKIIPKKKTREELLETINELVQAKESLTRELERVKNYHDNLEVYNKMLKAKQQQIQFKQSEPNNEPIEKSLNLGSELSQNQTPFEKSLNLGSELSQNKTPFEKSLKLGSELSQNKTPISFLLKNHQQAQPQFLTLLQQQEFIFANSFKNFQYPCTQTFPLTLPLSPPPLPSAPAKVSHVASPGLPDLNISADEALDEEHLQPSDRNIQDGYRARATEARKRRMVRVKERKLNLAPSQC